MMCIFSSLHLPGDRCGTGECGTISENGMMNIQHSRKCKCTVNSIELPGYSWAKFYQTYVVEQDKYYVFSYDSLTTNFGLEPGEHFSHNSSAFQSLLF